MRLRSGHADHQALRERENAARERDQHEHEQPEFDDRRPAHRHERRRQTLDQSERDAAEQRAGRIAEPAQHGHHEALELVDSTRQHRERKHGGDQRAGRAGERDAEPERDGEHLLGRNAGRARPPRGCWRRRGSPCRSGCGRAADRAGPRSAPASSGGHDVGAGEGVALPADARAATPERCRGSWSTARCRCPIRIMLHGKGREQAHQDRAADHAMHGDPIEHDADHEADDDRRSGCAS